MRTSFITGFLPMKRPFESLFTSLSTVVIVALSVPFQFIFFQLSNLYFSTVLYPPLFFYVTSKYFISSENFLNISL
jgi:hypothetical protein